MNASRTDAPISAALIGAGQRGYFIYGEAALRRGDIRFDAVVEPDRSRRERFAAAHDIPCDRCFERLDDLRSAQPSVDAWFVSSPDRAHHEAIVAAIDDRVALFVEKPVVTDVGQLLDVAARARANGALVHVAHVLRYAPLHQQVHRLLAEGAVGQIVSVAHTENVHALHMAHSYVRGNWSVESRSSPMLLAKASHDLDLLTWNLSSGVARLSSFGTLSHFRSDRAPEGSLLRCTDGCPVADCLFDARQQYLGTNTSWPVHAITEDLSIAGRQRALESGPYGRCVYHSDNDVVDHQVIHMQLHDGATVAFRMHGHAHEDGRTMRYDGTRATLRAISSSSTHEIEILSHRGEAVDRIVVRPDDDCDPHGMGHGGGDDGVLDVFVDAVRTGEPTPTSLEDTVESHLLAFAAEHARRTATVVDVDAFRAANEPMALLGRPGHAAPATRLPESPR